MNRKIVTMLIFGIVLFVGCRSGYNVLVKDDPFKKTKTAKVEMWHKVVEGQLDNQSIIYEREIKRGEKTPVIVSFRFYANSDFNSKDFQDKIYLLVDNRSFSLPMIDKKVDLYTKTKSRGAIIGNTWSGSTQTTIEGRYIHGKFQLTSEIEQTILNCNDYSIRVYMDTESTTLKATDNQLKAVKQFLMVGD